MAKEFNKVISVAKETTYATASNGLLVAASMNNQASFTPMFKSNGAIGTTGEYKMQRTIRSKSGLVANANSGSTSDELAILDSFDTINWETVDIVTGPARSIGLKLGVNEQYDSDDIGEVYAKQLADQVGNMAITRKENLYAEIVDNAPLVGTLAFTAGGTAIFDAISEEARRIQMFADDYKYMTTADMQVVVMHPSVADMVAKEIGTVFNQEAPIYQTGLMSTFSINGIPVIVDPMLNAFAGSAADTVVGAFILDVEAVAFMSDAVDTAVDHKLATTRYVGHVSYDVQKLFDTARAGKFDFASTTPTLPVND